ncbi:MAG TPA: diacylglycerol kinase family protein [Vicinamibacterales bacterium]|nr:diacylglycerol kinase family protein [Vicinamibacterales bacterium]
MKALVVINPIAGPGRTRTIGACVDLAKSVLTAHHYETDVLVTRGPADAFEFSAEAARNGADLLVAWGGDGTVNGVACAAATANVAFAIVPGGSGNGLARDLGVPFNPTEALKLAGSGRVRRIDAGDLHGSLFFNVAGIGFDARIAERLAMPGARRGLLGYIMATMGELRQYEPGTYSIRGAFDVNGTSHMADIIDHSALFIALANSRQYGNGAQIAPKALLDDGMIEIVVVEPQSGLSIMKQVPAFFRGTLQEGPGMLMRSAASMEISCTHPIRFHVDGEPRVGPQLIRLQTRRNALPVKVSH